MWYDVVMLVVLVYCTAKGASRGLIWQLAAIAGIVLCLMFAETFSAIVGPHIALNPPLNQWVTLFAAYLFFSFIAFGVARFINSGIEKADLKEFNRHLGAIFGFLKGGVICMVMTFFIATLPSMHESIKSSKSGHIAARVMNSIHPIMPDGLRNALEQYIHSLDDVDPNAPLLPSATGEPDSALAEVVRAAQSVEQLANATGQSATTTGGGILSKIFGSTTTTTPPPTSVPVPQPQSVNPFDPPVSQYQTPISTIQQPPAQAPYSSVLPNGIAAPNDRSTVPGGAAVSTPANTAPAYTAPYSGRSSVSSTVPGMSTATPATNNGYAPVAPAQPDFWSQIPRTVDADAQQKLHDTLQQFDPQTQQELQSQILKILKTVSPQESAQLSDGLKQVTSANLQQYLGAWNQYVASLPAAAPATSQPTNSSALPAGQQQLVTQITQMRSSFLQVQQKMQTEIQGLIAGVPASVGNAALQDWLADLNNDQAHDPDQTTDSTASIETRILHQMKSYGVSVDSLDNSLRMRLSDGADPDVQLR